MAAVGPQASIERYHSDDVMRTASQVRPRFSVAVPPEGKLIYDLGDDADDEKSRYEHVLESAHKCVGHGSAEGAFPEEWDAQLLVGCNKNHQNHRVVLFVPAFLKYCVDDDEEMDRAFKFVILMMDKLVQKDKYIFIYCHSGTQWTHPELVHRLRIAYDILPNSYAKRLKRMYILHPTYGIRIGIAGMWPWISGRLWEKMQFVDNLDELCTLIHPKDTNARRELRRRFPHLVQRVDAEWWGRTPPVIFGAPLSKICQDISVDFLDKTTGRLYPRLPSGVVSLCETLERTSADEVFACMFNVDAALVQQTVHVLDEGDPLDPDTPGQVLWCTLKLFLDCLPVPLLCFDTYDELVKRNLTTDDRSALRNLLLEVLHQHLPRDSAFLALYLASFFHTMCENSMLRDKTEPSVIETKLSTSSSVEVIASETPIIELNPSFAAEVFASGFVRPKDPATKTQDISPVINSLVETLILSSEDLTFWVGERITPPPFEEEDEDRESHSE